MTDDNVRPEANPSRESRPESLDDAVHDDAPAGVDAPDEGAATGDTPSDEVVGRERGGDTDDAATGQNSVEPPSVPDDPDATEDATEPGDEAAEPAAEPATEVIDVPVADAEVDARGDGHDATDLEIAVTTGADAEASDGGETPATDATTAEAEAEAVASASAAGEVPAAPAVAVDQPRDTFTWHPDHKGKSFDEVRASLAQDIAADQRQHRLAMDGAEESEQEALASVVSLERKWGKYDFDWAEQEPDALADRIFEFERERERRRQMISWSEFRDGGGAPDDAQVDGERAAELSSGAKGLSLLLVVLLIVVILLAVWAL